MVEENYAEVRGFSWAWCDKTNELCESNKVLLTDLEASTASVATPVEEKKQPGFASKETRAKKSEPVC